MNDHQLMLASEVADMLGVCDQTMIDWRRAGKGPKWKRISGNDRDVIRYFRHSVEAFQREREQEMTDA